MTLGKVKVTRNRSMRVRKPRQGKKASDGEGVGLLQPIGPATVTVTCTHPCVHCGTALKEA